MGRFKAKIPRKVVHIWWFSPLIWLLFAGSGPGFVLCHGEDGHVAVEVAGGDCCGDLSADAPHRDSVGSAGQELPSQKDNCGSCVDISISIGSAMVSKKPNHVNPALLVSTIPAPVNISSPDFSEYQLAPESFIPTPYFTPLRSIILLA